MCREYDVSFPCSFYFHSDETIHGHSQSHGHISMINFRRPVSNINFTFDFKVELIVRSLPDVYAERTLQFIAKYLNASHHVEFYLHWACSILSFHGPKDNILSHQSLLTLHQSLSRKYELLSKVCDFNKYTMQVLLNMANEVPERVTVDGDESDDDENLVLIRSNGNDHDEEDAGDDEEMASTDSEDED